jgi:hypothetical protein
MVMFMKETLRTINPMAKESSNTSLAMFTLEECEMEFETDVELSPENL